MHRAYVPPSFIDDFLVNKNAPLPSEVEKRFFKILRIAPKEVVAVFDGEGRSITGTLLSLASGCVISGVVETFVARSPKLILLQAAIEEKKLAETLRHGTELGIDAFALFLAKRSEPFVFESLKKRADRLQSVVIDASRQCGRVYCPSISFYESLPTFFKHNPPETLLGFVGCVNQTMTLRQTLSEINSFPEKIVTAIGPEGGLTNAEEKELPNFFKISLGPFVLRSEFAGLAASAIINQWLT